MTAHVITKLNNFKPSHFRVFLSSSSDLRTSLGMGTDHAKSRPVVLLGLLSVQNDPRRGNAYDPVKDVVDRLGPCLYAGISQPNLPQTPDALAKPLDRRAKVAESYDPIGRVGRVGRPDVAERKPE
jgi:hypothetical protein